jgi:hypothetical protein
MSSRRPRKRSAGAHSGHKSSSSTTPPAPVTPPSLPPLAHYLDALVAGSVLLEDVLAQAIQAADRSPR